MMHAAPFSQIGASSSFGPQAGFGGLGSSAPGSLFSLTSGGAWGAREQHGGCGGLQRSFSLGGDASPSFSPFSSIGGGSPSYSPAPSAGSWAAASGGAYHPAGAFGGGAAAAAPAAPFSFAAGGGGGGGHFAPFSNISAPPAAAAPFSLGGGAGGFSGAPRGVLKVGGGGGGGGGGAVCAHAAGQRLVFAPEVKVHDGLLPQHAAFDALVGAMTHGELAPGTAAAPGREEVMAMSDHVYKRYARGSPALCAQLLALSDDLVNRLVWAKQADDAAAAAAAAGAFRAATAPVLCGGGGSTSRLRSQHLPAAIFMQTLVRLACTLHPAH